MKNLLRLLMLIFIASQFWKPGEIVKPKKVECLKYNMFDNKCEMWDN